MNNYYMIIACKKFRSRITGYYNRLCHIIMCNMCEGWGLIYLCAMRTMPMSCHMLLHIMCALRSVCTQASCCPYVNIACQKLLMHMPLTPAKLYLSKLTASHFSTLNMKIANQNMLKMILIAMTTRTRLIAMRTSGYVHRNL